MKPKDLKEFNALQTVEDKAKWLLRKGVTSKLTMFPESNKASHAAYAAGVMLPGNYETMEEAIAGGTAFLSEKAGIKNH